MKIPELKLYKIRKWIIGLTPLYISVCAALLLDFRSNMNDNIISFSSYIIGLMFFSIACVISNRLSIKCDGYGRKYDIDYSRGTRPKLENIYSEMENETNLKMRYLCNYGVFVFGFLGLITVICSHIFSDNTNQYSENQISCLRFQIDSLKSINIECERQMLEFTCGDENQSSFQAQTP